MTDLISRQELEEYICDEAGIPLNGNMKVNVATVRNWIRCAVPVDAEPVRRGHWEWRLVTTVSDGEEWQEAKSVCSLCGVANKRYMPPYCPHCGAKMDEEVDRHG